MKKGQKNTSVQNAGCPLMTEEVFCYSKTIIRDKYTSITSVAYTHLGYHIKVKHNDTYETLYAHCSSICVTVGQEVKQGEVIGYVGTTGNSTGNHLHFEVWQNGERTDALGFFKAE